MMSPAGVALVLNHGPPEGLLDRVNDLADLVEGGELRFDDAGNLHRTGRGRVPPIEMIARPTD